MPHAPHNPRTGKLLLLTAAFALACLQATAQATPKPSPSTPANTSTPTSGGQIVPTPPPTPNWPVNQAPAPAQIKWDSQGLQVTAANSSLRQILTDIATRTGAKLEGMSSDERVFGEYGPGQARDILAQLLHGSSYNVLLIGDQGQGTPRQIVLSRRVASSNAPQPGVQNNSQDSDEDSEPAQPPQDEQPPPQQPQQPPAQRTDRPGAMGPRMGVPMQPGQQPNQQQQPQ